MTGKGRRNDENDKKEKRYMKRREGKCRREEEEERHVRMRKDKRQESEEGEDGREEFLRDMIKERMTSNKIHNDKENEKVDEILGRWHQTWVVQKRSQTRHD